MYFLAKIWDPAKTLFIMGFDFGVGFFVFLFLTNNETKRYYLFDYH